MTTEKRKKAPGRTFTQAERRAAGAREIVSITLTPEAKEALDLLRGTDSRGDYIEALIEEALHG